MRDMDTEQIGEATGTEGVTAPVEVTRTSTRRRLLKRGVAVAPVVLTLASRPVLAWHCKSPSAWGSEQLNPQTSLAANDGHKSWGDETWTISNWVNNTSRNGFGQPWAKLQTQYPAIKSNSGAFDYTKVTIAKLFSKVPGLARPAGLSDTATVKSVLSSGGEFQKYIIVAQLNFILLAPLSSNDLERCITLSELNKMATGFYSPPNVTITWNQTDIKNFLYENYIVRP